MKYADVARLKGRVQQELLQAQCTLDVGEAEPQRQSNPLTPTVAMWAYSCARPG